ncbi:hypothetical protein E4T56_gene15288 [Termitomyces sp. T112]|nr:hypothetical protein E4T56_gene15288 [Termitomyces sp. T112]
MHPTCAANAPKYACCSLYVARSQPELGMNRFGGVVGNEESMHMSLWLPAAGEGFGSAEGQPRTVEHSEVGIANRDLRCHDLLWERSVCLGTKCRKNVQNKKVRSLYRNVFVALVTWHTSSALHVEPLCLLWFCSILSLFHSACIYRATKRSAPGVVAAASTAKRITRSCHDHVIIPSDLPETQST